MQNLVYLIYSCGGTHIYEYVILIPQEKKFKEKSLQRLKLFIVKYRLQKRKLRTTTTKEKNGYIIRPTQIQTGFFFSGCMEANLCHICHYLLLTCPKVISKVIGKGWHILDRLSTRKWRQLF